MPHRGPGRRGLWRDGCMTWRAGSDAPNSDLRGTSTPPRRRALPGRVRPRADRLFGLRGAGARARQPPSSATSATSPAGAQVQLADVPVGSVTVHRPRRHQGEGDPGLRPACPHPGQRQCRHRPHDDPRRQFVQLDVPKSTTARQPPRPRAGRRCHHHATPPRARRRAVRRRPVAGLRRRLDHRSRADRRGRRRRVHGAGGLAEGLPRTTSRR